jgi:hypothetical protein
VDDIWDLAEVRYPFTSAAEFFRDYATDRAALHLVFGWIAALLLAFHVLNAHQSWARKLLALYFGLTIFNNFAFQVLPGSSLGDIFGVLCAILFCVDACTSAKARRASLLGAVICAVGVVFALHAALVGALYPELNAAGAAVLRFLVISKVFVFGINIWLFDQAFEKEEQVLWFIRGTVGFALVGIFAYFIQAGLLLTGTVPYGTYIDAGFIGFPSFGGVSIERGHFGKFLTPLFPLFLYLMLRDGRTKSFLLFVAVTLVNFSASSLSFFAVYVGMAMVAFRQKLLNLRVGLLLTVIGAAACAFIVSTWRLWAGVLDKIYDVAFQGGRGGGRDVGTFVDYLETYPFGISYGGSSLRIAPGLNEINGGVFSLITQMSFLSGLLIAGFVVLVTHAFVVARRLEDRNMRDALSIGILAIPFIFATDTLWFVPTIWLPILLAYRLADIQGSETTARRTIYDVVPILSGRLDPK